MRCQDQCLVMDFDGHTEFSSVETRKAAKQHRCAECAATIAIDEMHEYARGKCDGDFWDSRTCSICVEIRRAFACDGYVVTCLWEDIREQMFHDWNEMVAIDCLAKLTTDAAIAKMRAEYANYRRVRT